MFCCRGATIPFFLELESNLFWNRFQYSKKMIFGGVGIGIINSRKMMKIRFHFRNRNTSSLSAYDFEFLAVLLQDERPDDLPHFSLGGDLQVVALDDANALIV